MTRRARSVRPDDARAPRSSTVPPRLVRRLRFGACAGVLALSSVLAGCGGGQEDAADPTAASSASDDGGASDAGGPGDEASSGSQGPGKGGADGNASDGGGASDGEDQQTPDAEDPVPVVPPDQKVKLSNACTGEGTYMVRKDTHVDPKLPARGGEKLDVRLEGVKDDGADMISTAGGKDRPIETAHVGDVISIDGWTFSLTSVCDDQVEFDLID